MVAPWAARLCLGVVIDLSYQTAVTAIDGGAMDQFDLIERGNVKGDLLAYTRFAEELAGADAGWG